MVEVILMEGAVWAAGEREKNRAKHSIKTVTVKEDELRNSKPFTIDLSVYVKLSRTGPHEPCTSGGPDTRFAPKKFTAIIQVKAPFP